MRKKSWLPILSSGTLVIMAAALAKFIIHMLTGANYGYFCDELYTIDLSKHLAFGYVDLPPLVPALVALSRAIFGESLLALHIVPALAGSGTLVLVCLITREFGGKAFAIGLAALGFVVAPVWLILDSFFCYDSIDQLILAAFLYLLARFIRSGNRKSWIALGALAGLACMAKATILFLGPGLVIALLVSKYRRQLLTPWPWIGATAFLLIISPYLAWENAHHWPTIAYWANYGSKKLYHSSIFQYFVNIALSMNVALVPLLGLGLYRIFKKLGDTNYSFLGVMFLVTSTLLFFMHARAFMLAELYIPLIAAGSIWIEEQLSGPGWGSGMRVAAVSILAAGGLIVAPASLPILPLSALPAYAKTFGFLYQPVKDFNYSKGDYPQEFSNRIGWEALVKRVSDIYRALPAEDEREAGIWADWYGPAGAIDLMGPRYGLPHAISGHLTYHLWGPGEGSWNVMIVVTGTPDWVQSFFVTTQLVTIVSNEFSMPGEAYYIYVCKIPRASPRALWTGTQIY